MPGVTISEVRRRTRARIAAISCGEATTPSRPASCARRARRSTCSSTGRSTPISRERRLVHARQHGDGDHERRAARRAPPRSSRAASRAACIIARAARRVHVDHPRAEPRRRRDRAGDGVRDVVELQVEEDAIAAARRASRTIAGPSRGEQLVADLEAADGAAQRVGERERPWPPCRRRARRGSDSCVARPSAASVSTVPTRSASCVDAVALPCSRAMPSSSFGQMNGSTKFAVPTCTAVGAGDDELERVARVGDAAHADDRNLHRLPALVDHAHGDRPDGRAAQAADARSRASAAASRRRWPSPGTC